MTQKRYTEIPKRQKCINKEEPYIGGAKDIIDDELEQPQAVINSAIERKYNSQAPNGMGKVVLKKNKSFASQVTEPNTIYVIQYNFTLTDDVTIPANCVLEFDGGSISGNYTITGQNTGIEAGLIKIFNTDITFAGTWNIDKILANWFIASNDTAMFQAAFDMGKNINERPDYAYYITVNCLTKEYTISDTLFINYRVSFDGNNSRFIPSNNLGNKYMFSCNSSDCAEWDAAYPGNFQCEIGNFRVLGSFGDGVKPRVIFCGDSRKIHDIDATNVTKLILYAAGYIDGKTIERVYCNNPMSNVDKTSEQSIWNTCDVSLGIGDNANIKNCSFNLAADNLASVHVDSFMGFIYANTVKVLVCTNIHTEGGQFMRVYGRSNVEINGLDAEVIYPDPVIQAFNSGGFRPVITLNNCVFTKLSGLGNNYWTYKALAGEAIFNVRNTFGVLSWDTGGNDRGNGVAVALLHPISNNYHIDGNNGIAFYKDIIKDYSIEGSLLNDTEKFSANTSGTDMYVKVIYLPPIPYSLFYFDSYILGLKENTGVHLYSFNNPATALGGLIIRFEIGETENNLTHYFEFKTVNGRIMNFAINKTENGYTFNNIPAKQIDYRKDDYIKIVHFENSGFQQTVKLSSDQTTLPLYTTSTMGIGDRIITHENIELLVDNDRNLQPFNAPTGSVRPQYHLRKGQQFNDISLSPFKPIYWNGTDWVDATGQTV